MFLTVGETVPPLSGFPEAGGPFHPIPAAYAILLCPKSMGEGWTEVFWDLILSFVHGPKVDASLLNLHRSATRLSYSGVVTYIALGLQTLSAISHLAVWVVPFFWLTWSERSLYATLRFNSMNAHSCLPCSYRHAV